MKDVKDEVQKELDEPVVQAVTKIAEHVAAQDEKLKAEKAAIEAKVDSVDDKMEKGFATVDEKMERLYERTSAVSRMTRFEDVTEPIQAALSDDVKAKGFSRYEPVARMFAARDADSELKDPMVTAATTRWFQLATRLQLGGKFNASQGSDRKEFDTLDDAFRAVSKASLQEDTATEGGNLVPTIVESTVQRQILDAGRVFPRCRQMMMTKKVHKLPAESAAVTVNWIEEEGTLTAGEPTFSQLTLTAEKVAGRATMSIELVDDSNVGLLPYLLGVFSEKIAAELDYQVVGGTGTGPQITGIINGASVNAVTSATAAGRALTYALLVSTYMGASQANSRDGGAWICSPAGYTQLLSLVDGNSRPLVSYTGAEVRGATPTTFLGHGIIESGSVGGSGAKSLDDTTNTATSIVFAPLNSYVFGTRQGLRWDVTDQVNWAKYQMDARLIGRFAGVPGVSANFSYLGQVAY